MTSKSTQIRPCLRCLLKALTAVIPWLLLAWAASHVNWYLSMAADVAFLVAASTRSRPERKHHEMHQ